MSEQARCPKCGYQTDGNICTHCGQADRREVEREPRGDHPRQQSCDDNNPASPSVFMEQAEVRDE